MINFQLTHVKQYCYRQDGYWISPYLTLNLNISGLNYSKITFPSGKIVKPLDHYSPPFFSFLPSGIQSDFNYDDQRENWVVMFDGIRFKGPSMHENVIAIDYNDNWLELPLFLPIKPDTVNGWRLKLDEVRTDYCAISPSQQFSAHVKILDIINFISLQVDANRSSPTFKLKRLIDKDISFAQTLEEMCRQCHYSKDHLRVLFKQDMGMSPGTYRKQKRLERIRDLAEYSDLSVKEIARETGFSHAAHLCVFLKTELNLTPKEYIRSFRTV